MGAGRRDSGVEDPGSRIPDPGIVWKGDHDRTRRLGGVRTTTAIGAARWSKAQHIDVNTRFVHAV